eukprot:5657378-Prymnesium_polylepis.1
MRVTDCTPLVGTRCGAGYFAGNPLATTGYRWLPLATWRPGDQLATYWRRLLATWRPGGLRWVCVGVGGVVGR